MERTWDGLPVAQDPPHGVGIVVFRTGPFGREYLVLHRAHEGPDYEGAWAWGPPGGARLPGEPVDEAAKRELREETGLELEIHRTDLGAETFVVFVAVAPPGATVTLSDEHDRFRWLPALEAVATVSPDIVAEQIARVDGRLGRCA